MLNQIKVSSKKVLTVAPLMVALTIGLIVSGAVQSQNEAPSAQSGDAAAPVPAVAPLQGGIQVIHLNLQMLHDFGLDLKKLLRSTGDLYDEVTIQPVSLVTQPEIIGAGTIIYVPIATQPTGAYIPPRKKRVDLAMGDIRSIVSLLKEDADQAVAGNLKVDYPGDTETTLQPDIKSWVTSIEDMGQHFQKLETLTAGPTYDNAGIATEVTAIHKISQDLDKSRRKVYKVVQKEGKKQSKAAQS
jgi:hypothetical protein